MRPDGGFAIELGTGGLSGTMGTLAVGPRIRWAMGHTRDGRVDAQGPPNYNFGDVEIALMGRLSILAVF